MYQSSVRLSAVDGSSYKKQIPLLICPVFEGDKLSKEQTVLSGYTAAKFSEAADLHEFKGKKGQSFLSAGNAKSAATKVLFVGLGDTKTKNTLDIEKAGSTLFDTVKSLSAKEAHFILPFKASKLDVEQFTRAYVTGFLLKSYTYDTHKTDKSTHQKLALKKLKAINEDPKALDVVLSEAEAIAHGVFVARTLTNEPPNHLRPHLYAKEIKSLFKGTKVKVTALGEKKLETLGAHLMLSVGQASTSESHLVIMEYNGLKGKAKKTAKPIAFVGKGISFDTGGNNLKPFQGMLGMKADMGGSAVVVGLLKSLEARQAPVHAIGIVALAENMVAGNASRPSDVVTSLSGKTVEILNTDAEGRLVLADAMTYVQDKYKPSHMIDLATLTGAIIQALGGEYAGIFSDQDDVADNLSKAGMVANEPVWRLPICEAYEKALTSEVADMTNLGKTGTGAGSATAAAFLKAFVQKGVKWAHIDIAGTTMMKGSWTHLDKGSTGYGVRLLNQFVDDHV